LFDQLSINEAEVKVPPGALNPICPPSFAASRAPKVKLFSLGPKLDVPIAALPVIIADPVTVNGPTTDKDPVILILPEVSAIALPPYVKAPVPNLPKAV
jgi:hypothetical protein